MTEEGRQKLEEACRAYELRLERCRGNLTALKEQIAGKEKIAVDGLKIRIQELEKEQQQRENEEKELFGMRKNNQKCLKTMGGAAESSGKTAGRIPGGVWITFKPDCQWKPGADGTSGFSDLYAEKLFQTDDSGGKPQAGAG